MLIDLDSRKSAIENLCENGFSDLTQISDPEALNALIYTSALLCYSSV